MPLGREADPAEGRLDGRGPEADTGRETDQMYLHAIEQPGLQAEYRGLELERVMDVGGGQ